MVYDIHVTNEQAHSRLCASIVWTVIIRESLIIRHCTPRAFDLDSYAIQKLNGEIVNMATDLSVGEGIIGLQSETAEIFYRKIMIKEFDEEIPLQVFLKN